MGASHGSGDGLEAFRAPGRFWRGGVHAHSTESDGDQTIAEVVHSYQAAGYDFLAITDHFLQRFGYPLTDASDHDREGFVTIRSAEIHGGLVRAGEFWHLLAIGLPADFPPPADDEDGAALAGRAVAAGAFVAAAHPAGYGVTVEDIQSLGPIHAVETWNAGGVAEGRADSWYILDQLALRGGRYSGCVGDDAHFGADDNWQQAWVWVKAPELTPSAIVAGLRSGSYYSSTGPTIDSLELDAAEDLLTVRCSPCERITVTGVGSQRVRETGQDLVEAALDLTTMNREWRRGPYIRVSVRDRQGGRAWSNPIWLERYAQRSENS